MPVLNKLHNLGVEIKHNECICEYLYKVLLKKGRNGILSQGIEIHCRAHSLWGGLGRVNMITHSSYLSGTHRKRTFAFLTEVSVSGLTDVCVEETPEKLQLMSSKIWEKKAYK